MGRIGHGYGSEWHLLRYLGRHRCLLDEKVLRLLGADEIRWLDFGFKKSGKWHDEELIGVRFIRDTAIASKWSEFWPQTGNVQNWDAVAELRFGKRVEWLMVEAKSHVAEMESRCGAKPHGGRARIQNSMHVVKKALGVPESADWLNGYYQYCNRVAALYFLRQNRVPAQLLFIYFLGDSFPRGARECPSSVSGWKPAVDAQDKHVGLPAHHPLADRIHKLFLPVGSR